jgi:hypothetical protein
MIQSSIQTTTIHIVQHHHSSLGNVSVDSCDTACVSTVRIYSILNSYETRKRSGSEWKQSLVQTPLQHGIICHPFLLSLKHHSSREDMDHPEQVKVKPAARDIHKRMDGLSPESLTPESPPFRHAVAVTTPIRMPELKLDDENSHVRTTTDVATTGLAVVAAEDLTAIPMPKDTAGGAIHITDAAVDAVDVTEEYRDTTAAWRRRKLQEKVYERHQEQAQLQMYFQKTRKKHGDTAMFLLISGDVGTGKTRLARWMLSDGQV